MDKQEVANVSHHKQGLPVQEGMRLAHKMTSNNIRDWSFQKGNVICILMQEKMRIDALSPSSAGKMPVHRVILVLQLWKNIQ